MADIPESAMRLPSAAKSRILAAATELFYSEGIRATGVDRIIAEAKVTKSTFYKYYPAKDLLILDYLAYSSLRERTLLISLVAETDDPVRQLMRVTELIVTETALPNFRGCRFLNAATEFADPNHPVRQAVLEHRNWQVIFMQDIMRDLGHPLHGDAADDFMILRDGAVSGSYAGDRIAAIAALERGVQRIITEVRVPAQAAGQRR